MANLPTVFLGSAVLQEESMVLKRVGILSCARICGVLYAFMGLILGAVLSMIGVFASALGTGSKELGGPLLGILFGVGAILALPIIYGTMGFLAGALSAALYNWVSRFVGGIQMELE
jgi:hypothetical protein